MLIPHDCDTTNDLTVLDQNITKLSFANSRNENEFPFQVYDLKVNEKDHRYYAIQYANEPLKTLREMACSDGIRAVTKQTLEQEVKLLCRTLQVEILKDPRDQRCQKRVVLVPFKVETDVRTHLQNGGLVRCIMAKVNKTFGTQVDNAPAFVKLQKGTDKKLHSKNGGNQIGSNDARTSKKLQQKGKERKGKTKKIKKKNYKSKTSDETELKIMIPKESEEHEPPENTKSKPNIRMPITECGNDPGASTSGVNSEIINERDGNFEDELDLR